MTFCKTFLSRYTFPNKSCMMKEVNKRRFQGGEIYGQYRHHLCECDPCTFGGRRAEGELRPSGPAARRSPDRLRTLGAPHEAQRQESKLGEPRPLHPLRRARLRHALFPAAPLRLRADARRPQEFPPGRILDARPSRVPSYEGRGSHDRASGRRHGHGGRHGDC